MRCRWRGDPCGWLYTLLWSPDGLLGGHRAALVSFLPSVLQPKNWEGTFLPSEPRAFTSREIIWGEHSVCFWWSSGIESQKGSYFGLSASTERFSYPAVGAVLEGGRRNTSGSHLLGFDQSSLWKVSWQKSLPHGIGESRLGIPFYVETMQTKIPPWWLSDKGINWLYKVMRLLGHSHQCTRNTFY